MAAVFEGRKPLTVVLSPCLRGEAKRTRKIPCAHERKPRLSALISLLAAPRPFALDGWQ